jgi:methylmalonyl-CoA mutase C-terminal domain/subunit
LDRKIRILIGKVGLDGHDRGAKVIAAAFRDAGFEVIYAGLRQTPESITEAAIQEDVDAIGISILSGAHMTIFPKIRNLMTDKGLNDVLLFGGGIIPQKDIEELSKIGVGKLFTPGATTMDTIEYVKNWVNANRKI